MAAVRGNSGSGRIVRHSDLLLTPDPVVYRISGRKQAALPTADRYPNPRIRRGLHPVGARGFEPRTSSLSGTRSKPTELCAQFPTEFPTVRSAGHWRDGPDPGGNRDAVGTAYSTSHLWPVKPGPVEVAVGLAAGRLQAGIDGRSHLPGDHPRHKQLAGNNFRHLPGVPGSSDSVLWRRKLSHRQSHRQLPALHGDHTKQCLSPHQYNRYNRKYRHKPVMFEAGLAETGEGVSICLSSTSYRTKFKERTVRCNSRLSAVWLPGV